MTAFIRPGRYAIAICEDEDGSRSQTPWCRLDRDRGTPFFREMVDARRARGFKVLYIVRATIPQPSMVPVSEALRTDPEAAP